MAAVATVPEYFNITQGNSPGVPTATSYFAESSKLNSLADVLSDCVNTSGGSAGDGSPCGALFSTAARVTDPVLPAAFRLIPWRLRCASRRVPR